jgi:hypothetical protein
VTLDISALEDAIATTILADTWFASNVTTVEARYRRVTQDYLRKTFGFSPETELPALIDVAAIQRNGFEGSIKRAPLGYGGEIDSIVPMAIISIVSASDYEDAEELIIKILEETARLAGEQISNTKDWGVAAGTIIESIDDGYEVVKPDGAAFHVAVGVTRFDVQVL